MKQHLINGYKNVFKDSPKLLYFSPGRVNIIGEHIDYNGGKVLPMGISLGIYGAITFNNGTKCRCVSEGFLHEKIIEFDLNSFSESDDFTKYIYEDIKDLGIKPSLAITHLNETDDKILFRDEDMPLETLIELLHNDFRDIYISRNHYDIEKVSLDNFVSN